MFVPPVERITRILGGVDAALAEHVRECGDRVLAIALHPSDHEVLCVAEIWGAYVPGGASAPCAAMTQDGVMKRRRRSATITASGGAGTRRDVLEEIPLQKGLRPRGDVVLVVRGPAKLWC